MFDLIRDAMNTAEFFLEDPPRIQDFAEELFEDEEEEEENEDEYDFPDDPFDECGFDPYAGCYDFDC